MAKILVADDEKQILYVILDILESAGHETVGVAGGVQAFALLEQQHFDLALVDVMMPKLDGYHLAAKIHGLPNPPTVVIITARNFEQDERTLNIVGVAAFLPKPFSNKELLEVVARLLHEKKYSPPLS